MDAKKLGLDLSKGDHEMKNGLPELKEKEEESTANIAKALSNINVKFVIKNNKIYVKASTQTKSVSLEDAIGYVTKAVDASLKKDLKMNIAVVGVDGKLTAFARMDGAWQGSIDIAIKKAQTARLFDMPTDELGKLSQPGKDLYGIEHSNGGLITFAGGLPIKDGDEVVGAIGVSGGTVEEDKDIATAALKKGKE